METKQKKVWNGAAKTGVSESLMAVLRP